ncbi:MAG: tRNA (cytidine/uridine-2-O-)-methyltransferase [Pseudomonadota bacterium]|nr:tRNA (cytidine/uridine-2-O-)-methyltransferase [Pseudomonadota bacterium]
MTRIIPSVSVFHHSMKGFSPRNLKYMRAFAEAWPGAEVEFRPDDALLFGPESRGLPPEVLAQFDADHRLRLPMLPGSRSMNLSNAVSVVVFEAWRQNGFAGGV